MDRERVTEISTIKNDKWRYAEPAFLNAQTASSKLPDNAKFLQFLYDQALHEELNAQHQKKYQKTLYHPNVGLASQLRKDAFELMISRFKI